MKQPLPKKKNKIHPPEGVLLEHISSQLEQVLEGHTVLDMKIERVDAKVEKLSNKTEELDTKIEKLDTNVENLSEETGSNFKVVFDYLKNVDKELIFIKAEIADLKTRMTAKTDKARFIDFERRVIRIEKELAERKK